MFIRTNFCTLTIEHFNHIYNSNLVTDQINHVHTKNQSLDP